MDRFKIITDTSCDFSLEQYKKYNIDFVSYYVSFDGVNYLKEHKEISPSEFYQELSKKGFAKTSLPSVQDYIDCFRPYLENNQDIMCFCLSSKFSGSFQSAKNAQSILLEEYLDRKIFIIDSYNATVGQALIILQAKKMMEDGMDIEQISKIIEDTKKTADITFTIDSLEYLKKGGRIGAVSALAGSLLNIKPIIKLQDGELKPYSKIRGRKKALNEVMEVVMNLVGENKYDYDFYITSSECFDECIWVRDKLKNDYNIEVSLPIGEVGVTIGCHTGPTALGIGTIKKYDKI